MKTIDKLKRLRDELKQEERGEYKIYINLSEIISRLDAIIEAEEQSETPPNTEKRDQFGVIAESDKEIVCELCVYFRRDNYNTKICDHCVDHNNDNEYYISK